MLVTPSGMVMAVTSIGYDAFMGCSSLERVTINCANVGDWFKGLSSIKECVLGERVTSIGKEIFADCSNLKVLTLGKGLKKIAAEAFSTCEALEKITIHATQPPRIEGNGNALFSDATYDNATLYVPQGSISKYQVMTGWSGFYNIIGMESGIENMELTHQNSPLIYDLNGRRVATPTKGGIYIINGRKVVVKIGM